MHCHPTLKLWWCLCHFFLTSLDPDDRPIGRSASRGSEGGSQGSFREGAKVEAKYRGKARYYPGVIKRANRDGTYDVDYDDVSPTAEAPP